MSEALFRADADGEALWALLAQRAARYTQGDSSSLPAALAAELLEGVRYTLALAPDGPESLPERFALGQRAARAMAGRCRTLWKAACLSAPEPDNRALRDTLKSVGTVFRRYDAAYFPQSLPCDVDYQLLRPLPEGAGGMVYLEKWLRRLLAENALLRRFDPAKKRALLAAACPEYEALLVNLCEPVYANALALALLGERPEGLDVTAAQRQKLLQRLSAEPAARAAALKKAAGVVCGTLSDGFARAYLTAAAQDLSPRLGAALEAGELSCIFVSLS